MASDDHTDLFIKFVPKGTAPDGKALEAESRTNFLASLIKPNPLLKGFERGSFMDVEEFSFKVGNKQPTRGELDKGQSFSFEGKTVRIPPDPNRPKTEAPDDPNSNATHIDPGEVSFKRMIDKASALLMFHLLNRVPFDHATIIKRKSSGGHSSGEPFLRIDFTGVLLTKIDWSDDIKVKEGISFVYRSITLHYRPQLPNGTLGGIVPGFWSALASKAKPVSLR